MCGISGCISKKCAIRSTSHALNKLIGRGYDSSGVSTIIDGKIQIRKYVSQPNQNSIVFLNTDPICNIETDIAIGHNRWATHGAKTIENAHPHHDYKHRFAMVHNGIVENNIELKKELIENNYNFYGDTDTEIAVNYLHYLVSKNNDFSLLNKILKGSWAILFVDEMNPTRIYFLKNKSPLLMGFDKNNTKIMFASEFIGFDSDIETYININDYEHGYVNINSDGICNFVSSDDHNLQVVPSNCELDTKDPYKHWTIKEINDQPQALSRLLSTRLITSIIDSQTVTKTINIPELNSIYDEIVYAEHLILLACGTSFHAAYVGSRYFKELNPTLTINIYDGADFEEFEIPLGRKTVLIFLSQSGETIDLYRCLHIGKNLGIKTIGIINVENSLIAREVDVCLYVKSGRENAVASTKSFTNQVTMLLLLALWLQQNKNINRSITKYELTSLTPLGVNNQREKMAQSFFRASDIINKWTEYYDALTNLSKDYEKIINKAINEIPSMLDLFKGQTTSFILGKRSNEWIAKEGALKIKEITYIHCEGFSAAALKHGSFALLTVDTPVIILAPDDDLIEKISNTTSEIKSCLAKVIYITNKKSIPQIVDSSFYYETKSALFPLLSIVPLQILAYMLAIERGNNPDYPRNLAKVVAVE